MGFNVLRVRVRVLWVGVFKFRVLGVSILGVRVRVWPDRGFWG